MTGNGMSTASRSMQGRPAHIERSCWISHRQVLEPTHQVLLEKGPVAGASQVAFYPAYLASLDQMVALLVSLA